MEMDLHQIIQTVAIWALPVLFAITVHEAAHGYVAKRLGDTTAYMLGRVTLNPIKHIDPVGTVILPILLVIFAPFVFGWAKPVPVNWDNLNRPKRDMAFVALAGPAANLLMALGWAIMAKIAFALAPYSPWVSQPLLMMCEAGIFINIIFMLLNLIPIPPLDGGRILVSLAPNPISSWLMRVEPFGILLLLTLLLTGVLGYIIWPLAGLLQGLIGSLV